MAREISDSEKIQQLIRSSEAARGVLSEEIRAFKYKLDVPARMKDSLRNHPTGWLGGSLVAGMASSLLFRRKAKQEKESVKKKGLMGFMLTLGIAAARPAVKVWLAGRLKDFIASKVEQDSFADVSSRRPRRVAPF